jgi:hypothetical protein
LSVGLSIRVLALTPDIAASRSLPSKSSILSFVHAPPHPFLLHAHTPSSPSHCLLPLPNTPSRRSTTSPFWSEEPTAGPPVRLTCSLVLRTARSALFTASHCLDLLARTRYAGFRAGPGLVRTSPGFVSCSRSAGLRVGTALGKASPYFILLARTRPASRRAEPAHVRISPGFVLITLCRHSPWPHTCQSISLLSPAHTITLCRCSRGHCTCQSISLLCPAHALPVFALGLHLSEHLPVLFFS